MQLKHVIYGGVVASMAAFGTAQAFAEQFVSIGTGGVTGVYYPTGGARPSSPTSRARCDRTDPGRHAK